MVPNGGGRTRAAAIGFAVFALLALFAARALLAARHLSPTYDEVSHLPAGASYLATGDYRLNPEHPPLVKELCALPLVIGGENPDVGSPPLAAPWQARDQWGFGIAYLYGRNRDSQGLLMRGRAVAALMAAALGLIVFLWSRRIWGGAGGILSLFLFTFCPNILAHAPIVHTDLPLALAATGSIWLLWRFGEHPAGFAGSWLAAGCGMAMKFSGIVLLPLLAVLTLVKGGSFGGARAPGRASRFLLPPAGAALALAALSASYGFTGAARYLDGLSVLGAHSRAGHAAYFLGEVSHRGWLLYYPVAFLVKTPLSTLILLACGLLLPLRWTAPAREPVRARLALSLGMPACVLFVVPILGGLDLGVRYLLPAFPFLFILAGRLALWRGASPRVARATLAALLVWLAATSVASHPAYLAYFNEAAGGTEGGERFLSDSNLDWGQDLLPLAEWYRQERLPGIYLAWFGSAPPSAYGIRYRWLPGKGASSPLPFDVEIPPERELIVISLHCLLGVPYEGSDPFAWLRERRPLRSIGPSLRVFDISGDAQAHRALAAIYSDYGRPAESMREEARAREIEATKHP